MSSTRSFGELSLADTRLELQALKNSAAVERLDALVADPTTTDSLDTALADSGLRAPWKHTGATFGYVSADGVILRASTIQPDVSLKGARITLKCDRIQVANYPGIGEHELLYKWRAVHHVEGSNNNDAGLVFTQKITVRDGDSNAGTGLTCFVGLTVPPAGVSFGLDVIYVKNRSAGRFLDFLESDTVRKGLALAAGLNPAVGPLSEFSTGLVRSVLTANDGREIHRNVSLGLDFQDAPSGARLREGTYVIAQTPGSDLDWSPWRFGGDAIQGRNGEAFPFNATVIRVERFVG